MSSLIQDAAVWLAPTGLATTAVATVAAVRFYRASCQQARTVQDVRAAAQAAHAAVALRDQEADHFATVRVPAMVQALVQGRDGLGEDCGPRNAQAAGTASADAYRQALKEIAGLAEETTAQAEGSARSAVLAVVGSFRGLVAEQQATISALLDAVHDETVLEHALPIDHACSQLQRRAQIVGLLAGSWPGRQRQDALLLDVVRGGVSRIRDFTRVRVPAGRAEYLSGRVVEPVVLAVAELLDNAARHSEPGSQVEVRFVEARRGISIVIEDAGIGLRPEDRTAAARLLSGQEPVQLTRVRTPPRFGFLAIGVLAARYGFRVSVDEESVHGGVRAVVHLPHALLAAAPAAPVPAAAEPIPPADAGPPPPGPAAAQPEADPRPQQPEQGEYPVARDGLPVRRRGASGRRAAPAPGPGTSRPGPDSRRRLAQFVRGAPSARPTPPDEETS